MVGAQKESMSVVFSLTIFALVSNKFGPKRFKTEIFIQVSQILGDVIVELPNGKIQGVTEQTRTGQIYNSFYGVRYGKSPTNELRLQVRTYNLINSLLLLNGTFSAVPTCRTLGRYFRCNGRERNVLPSD